MGLKNMYATAPRPVQATVDFLYNMVPPSVKWGRAYGDMRRLLRAEESWSQDEIQHYQIAELKKLLQHAYHTTSYYHRTFDEAGFNPDNFADLSDMQKIPCITKEDVIAHGAEMLSSVFSTTQMLKETTGGTSGNQVSFYTQKRFSAARENACFDHLWGKLGYVRGKSELAVLRNRVLPKGKLWEYDYRLHGMIFDTYHLTDDNCEKIVTKLSELKIPFVWAYPSAVMVLARYMQRTGQFLGYQPRGLLLSSEEMRHGWHEYIEKSFGGGTCVFALRTHRKTRPGTVVPDRKSLPYRGTVWIRRATG